MRLDPASNRKKKREWNDNFSVGVDEIDDQHRTLLDLINTLRDMADSESPTKEKSFAALNAMIKYAESHFITEESYLEKYGYPEYLNQKKDHEDFVNEVFSMAQELEDKGIPIFETIAIYLEDWYADHVLGDDQKYKKFLSTKLKNPDPNSTEQDA